MCDVAIDLAVNNDYIAERLEILAYHSIFMLNGKIVGQY
jgi:hypothetical protein